MAWKEITDPSGRVTATAASITQGQLISVETSNGFGLREHMTALGFVRFTVDLDSAQEDQL